MLLFDKISRTQRRGSEGFTLIELLVVVLIIGVLAAIAVPIFFGQEENTRRAATEAAAVTGYKAVLVSATEGLDNAETLQAVERYSTEEVSVEAVKIGNDYCVTATHRVASVAPVTRGTCGDLTNPGGETPEAEDGIE